MNEQPGDLLDEAAKLLDSLRRRWDEAARGGGPAEPADAGDDSGGDVWSRVVAELEEADRSPRAAVEPGEGAETGSGHREHEEARDQPRIATGAPECRDCPICRVIAASRASGPGLREHLREAGRSLRAAVDDVAAAFGSAGAERTPGPRAGDDRDGPERRGPGAGDDPTDIG
jgi:hypothetical protein